MASKQTSGVGRVEIKATLNEKELNELWVPIKRLEGDVDNAKTIKQALKRAIKYHKLKQILRERYGIDLDILIEKLGDKRE